jgi:biopolymer transport protein ExbD
MAEIQSGGDDGHKKGKKPHAKKQSTRIDMTPMVDLAFLLLTFFMLTTTFNKPKVMEINMPVPQDENTPPTKVEDDKTTTILIGKDNKLFYYDGVFNPLDISTIKKTDYSKDGIRKMLINKNKKLYDIVAGFEQQRLDGRLNEKQYKDTVNWAKKQKENNGLFVIIKAVEESNYENIVNILDEMQICNVVNFALVDITPEEEKMIETL